MELGEMIRKETKRETKRGVLKWKQNFSPISYFLLFFQKGVRVTKTKVLAAELPKAMSHKLAMSLRLA